MRLNGQAKLGFFAIPPEAVSFLTRFLVAPTPDPLMGTTTILDPCCGKGAALKQFASALGIEERNAYGIELDEKRGEEAAASMPAAKIIHPADVQGVRVAFGSMSLLWLNPPYDDELGGGRPEEELFLSATMHTIARGGVLMFALPWPVLRQAHMIHALLMSHFENIVVVPYPEKVRKFNEVVVFAKRRTKFVDGHKLAWHQQHKYFGGDPGDHDAPRYLLPLVPDEARTFVKVSYTDAELAAAMAASKLNRIFDPPKPKPRPRPGLQLSAGQRALILAGGFLNCVIQKNGEAFLLKSSPHKDQFIKSQEESEVFNKKTGESELKTTTILSERIVLRVRVLDENGEIHDVK